MVAVAIRIVMVVVIVAYNDAKSTSTTSALNRHRFVLQSCSAARAHTWHDSSDGRTSFSVMSRDIHGEVCVMGCGREEKVGGGMLRGE